MQCTACRLHSNNLREYSRVAALGNNRKTIETAYLCPACRVLNVLNPRYIVQHTQRDLQRDLRMDDVRYGFRTLFGTHDAENLPELEIDTSDVEPVTVRC